MRRLVLAAASLSLLALPVPGRAATGACRVDLEQRNRWHLVDPALALAVADGDPCRMVGADERGVVVSDDGGTTWRRVGDVPTPPARLLGAGLPAGQVLLVGKDGSLWVSADRGSGWSRASGISGAVREVSADETAPTHLLAVVASATPSAPVTAPVTLPASGTATLYESRDGGRSFSAVVGATGLAVTSATVDAGSPSRWWLGVGGPAGGLYVSSDGGGSFTPVARGDVRALATSTLAGGGSEVVAATSDGLLVSRDGGNSVTTKLAGSSFSAVALEWHHPSAAMLLGPDVRRTSDAGASARPQSVGLPAGCAASDLRRDRSIPSVYLVTCADGSTWRYRGDGTDLTTTDAPDDGAGGTLLPGAPLPSTPMRVLRRLRITNSRSTADGSIAFDGTVLYYTDYNRSGRVHRMLASTGAALPDLPIGVRRPIGHLAYDANRDELVVLDKAFVVWSVSLRTGRVTRLFHAPLTGQSEDDDAKTDQFYGSMSYDSATDRLLFANDQSDSFYEFDRAGRQRHACPSLGLPTLISVNGSNGTGNRASIAGLVATGDGLVYVEAEDDSTVVRIDRSCHVLAQFTHEFFTEATNENDALACDTTTFGEPAVWLRDAQAMRIVAFSVESGYCALPSAVSVAAPPAVATGGSGRVCATLRSRAKGTPLPGQHVDLLVAGRGIGSPVTDRRGRACTDYVPTSQEAGAGSASSSARQPVLAAFLGTAAYRPASARASLVVSRAVVVPAPPAVEAQPAGPPVLAAPPPPPPVQPPQPPPPAPQQQPVAQGHPGAQPGAMGQLGAAAMPDDEAEAAAQGADTHLMTAVDWESYALPSAFGVLAFAAVLRRRRASRVRGQSA